MTQTTNTQTQKTLEEKLADITAKHGEDYVINWDNHPDIMQEFTQQIIADMEAETTSREETPKQDA